MLENKNYCALLGAIAGDTIGSVYEFNNIKDTDFDLFNPRMNYTDDSVMTLAVADWIVNDAALSFDDLVARMRGFSRMFPCPMGGYGSGFRRWLAESNPKPYNSWGNGSAMRVSAVGYAAETMEQALDWAKRSAEVTHNHPEGIKGAQATAAAIFMARTGSSKEQIRDYVEQTFGYDLHRTCDEIRPSYGFNESCQHTVPEAIVAFLDSNDFESAIRLAVSLGGDSDTLACITGGIAGAYYKNIPEEIGSFVATRLDRNLLDGLNEFCTKYGFKCLSVSKDAAVERRIASSSIVSLSDNEVFVFGSNLDGLHGGGAARVAVTKFGAVWGQGVGRQGRCYAIPTMQGGVETIKPYVDDFIEYAKGHPHEKYLVTRIGCGIAGFRDEEIAPLFEDALKVENIYLPHSWWGILEAE